MSRAVSAVPLDGFSRRGQRLKPGSCEPGSDMPAPLSMMMAARALARIAVVAMFALASVCFAAEKQRIEIDDYIIHAVVSPQTHQLKAQARVKFTALEDVNIATFELHNALRPTRVIDTNGQNLSVERVSQDSTVRVSLPNGLTKGSSDTLIFEYEGAIQSADDSPVQGLKLAYIGDPITYLLYAGRWFPMVGYGTDRFTATITVSVPAGYTVIGSGKQSAGPGAEAEEGAGSSRKGASQSGLNRLAIPGGGQTVTFTYEDRPSFPGTILIGKYVETKSTEGGLNISVYTTPEHKAVAEQYADTAVKEFFFFTTTYGPPFDQRLSVVELPNDTVPSAWAPEIAAVAGHHFTEKGDYRLLANTIAHQWFGTMVSPATKNDWWLNDGAARYSEALYVEHVAGTAGFQEVTKDMSVGALAYVSVPLADIGKLDAFSPEFQSLVTDKGGMILQMLRWVIGDEAFDKTMRTFVSQYSGKSATVDDFRKVAEQVSGQQLTWFFTQWLNSTGAPEFKNKYTVYRTQKGFRVVGEISQDMDLFRMPIELRVDTDGKTETKRVEVEGTNSAYAIETFGKPRRITIDPNNDVLQNSTDLQVRTSIMRGQQDIEQGDLTEALKEFQKALDINKNSSLAHYRIAEVFFLQHNYQSAANAYRESLNGDGEPRWTEVWSHIQLGMIFDLTGQRERATNEYRQALQTNDNTQNALDTARKYLQSPYQPQSSDKPGLQ
jgi:Peptidase family M1 domain/TPR repeat